MRSLYDDCDLDNLRKFMRDETVDPCLIDPSFNSKSNYNRTFNNIGTEDRTREQAFAEAWTWGDHANQCFEISLQTKAAFKTPNPLRW